METTLDLFAEGSPIIDKEYSKLNGSDEAILMVGNTGTGKSTLTYFIAGNNSAIIAYQKGVDYRIKDCNGKIGDSQLVSHTSFPEAVVEKETSTAFFDYPGFIDNRPVCVEIANAFFMLNVAQRLQRAKIIIAIEYSTISGEKGVFAKVLESVVDFIPNIKELGPGIGVVVTKVEKPKFSDAQVVSSIITFFNDALIDPKFATTFKDKTKYNKAVFIIEALLNDGRVGIFRAPDDCGPLSTLPSMVNNSISLKKVMLDSVNFTKVKASDFGISLSPVALLGIKEIRKVLSETITESLTSIGESVGSFLSDDCNEPTSCEEMLQLIQKLNADPYFANKYDDFSSWSGRSIIDTVANTTAIYFSIPELDISPNVSNALLTVAGHLDILGSIDKDTVQLEVVYKPLKNLHEKIKSRVPQLARVLEVNIDSILKTFSEAVFLNLFPGQPCDKAGCGLLLRNIQSLYGNVDFKNNYLYPGSWAGLSYQDTINQIVGVSIEGFEWDKDALATLQSYSRYLDMLLEVDSSLVVIVDYWLQRMRNLEVAIAVEVDGSFKANVYTHIWNATSFVYTTVFNNAVVNFNALEDIFPVQGIITNMTHSIAEYKEAIEYELLSNAGLLASNYVAITIHNCISLGLTNAEAVLYNEFNPVPYFTFFKSNNLSTEIRRSDINAWYKSLTIFVESVANEKAWYDFLVGLLGDLSHMNTQVNNVWKFKEWYTDNGEINPTDGNTELTAFWNNFSTVPSVKNLPLQNATNLLTNSQDRELKIKNLNLLLKTALTDKMTCLEINGARNCRGMFVSMKNVLAYKGLLSDLSTNSIVIKAFHTFYLDANVVGTNFNNQDNLDVYIISPNWVTSGGSLNLNGYTGGSEPPIGGIGGAQGKPGQVGGNGGNFYGIARIPFVTHPTVSVNGGKGGNGQDGQNGQTGTTGSVKPFGCDSDFNDEICTSHCNSTFNIIMLATMFLPCTCVDPYSGINGTNSCYDSKSEYGVVFTIPGTSGSPGENGGDGGRPGKGGIGGNYYRRIVEDSSNIDQTGLAGSDGVRGRGGSGGQGGRNGPTFEIKIRTQKTNGDYICGQLQPPTITAQNQLPSGNPGIDGGSSILPSNPIPHAFNYKTLVPAYIDEFKIATDIYLTNKFLKSPLREFLEKVDKMIV